MSLGPIRVLHVVLDMELGGLQRIVNLLIQRMDRNCVEPFLCCIGRGGIFFDQLTSEFVQGKVLPRRPGLFDIRMFRQLLAFIREQRIEVIHSHNGCAFYSGLAGRIARVKGIVHTDHGRLVPDRMGAIVEDRVASMLIDDVIGVSNELTSYLESRVGIGRAKLRTIINGVDTQSYVPIGADDRVATRAAAGLGKDAKVLGTVCRLDRVKNLPLIIRSMPEIRQSIPDVQLAIVGEGPEESYLRSIVDDLGLHSIVRFIGCKSDVENLLPAFDLYINTSISEGTCMAILEAMSCGLPIVASAVGGNSRLVNRDNGELFPSDRADLLAGVVISLLSDPMRLIELGLNSRRRARLDFSLDRVVADYQGLYRSYMN